MKEAAEFAESTQILMNVSEFTDVSRATDTLISAVQAFGYTAETSMDVVDLLNTIGNNYAISTADLAQSLTKSSASLVAAGGNLAEAAALTATANKIIQDADSVGTALKTTSLRLRGTDAKILEEEGLDSDGVVTSKSKLQSEVKALSGVDILTETGEYKSTYEILSQIADVWKDINDMDQAALLELISGKRNSSVIAAILQNPEELKAAFKDANNASGSALKENEKYLDSIQGKIDQFTNATQTMWSNLLDADWVKRIVEIGTWLIKLIDGVEILGVKIGGVIPTLIALAAVIAKIKYKLTWPELFTNVGVGVSKLNKNLTRLANRFGILSTATTTANAALNNLTVGQFNHAMATAGVDEAHRKAMRSQMGLTGATNAQTIAQGTLTTETLKEAVASGVLNSEQAILLANRYGLTLATVNLTSATAAQIMTDAGVSREQKKRIISALGLTMQTKALTREEFLNILATNGVENSNERAAIAALFFKDANEKLNFSFKSLGKGISKFIEQNKTLLTIAAVVAVIALVIKGVDNLINTSEELNEKLSESQNALEATTSELKDLRNELDEVNAAIQALQTKGTLSFTDQEELNRLRDQRRELESTIALKSQLETSQQKQVNQDAQAAYDSYKTTNFKNGKDKGQYAETGGNIGAVAGGVVGAVALGGTITAGVAAAGAKIGGVIGTALGGPVGTIIGIGLGALVGAVAGGLVGAAGGAVVSEAGKDVEEQLDEMKTERDKFKEKRDEAYRAYVADPENEKLLEKYEKAEEKLTEYDSKMAEHVAEIQQMRNQMDWSTATPSQRETIEEMDDFIDRYNIIMKSQGAVGSAIERILGYDRYDGISERIEALVEQYKETEDQTILTQISEEAKKAQADLADVGLSIQDVVDYYTLEKGLFDTSTIEGVTNQYLKGIKLMQELAENTKPIEIRIDDKIEKFTFDDLFEQDESGKFKAREKEFSEMLKGMDTKAQSTFKKFAENVKNGELTWKQAMEAMKHSANLAGYEFIGQQIAEANAEIFKGIQDDISGTIDTFSEFSAALEDVASSMDLLHKAQTQMNTAGRLSVKTALEIIENTDDWNKVLTITNGTITLQEGATETLIQSKLDLIKANIENEIQQLEEQKSTILAQDASNDFATTVEESTNLAIRNMAGSMAYLTTMMEAYTRAANGERINTEDFIAKAEKAKIEATNGAKGELDWKKNSAAKIGLDTINERLEDAYARQSLMNQMDTGSEFKNYYDFDKTPGDKYKDDSADERFKKAMDYWENRIAANQAKYEQIQNEIDLLEAKGMRAGEEYYREQIELENQRKSLLDQQKAEALKYLGTLNEGSDEWWEVANTINDIEGELDDVIASVQELNDAIGQIRWDGFEQLHDRFSNLTTDLENIRDILSNEDMFDDEGNFTKEGVANLATYIQELEIYKNALADVQEELADFQQGYEGNEDYFATIGIDSEQEYYDKLIELTDKQDEYTKTIKESEQSVVEMYENQIDAIEEYIGELIDGYNDYIDTVKDALDAERDLYDFKKNVQKQTKDISSLERRIAALSGSTNASDVALRRKLESELYEAKESLSDTYYEHSRDSQQQALDDEAQAYEESMNKYVEGLRTMLEEATENMTTFLSSVTNVVVQNAGSVEDVYNNTGLALDSAIVDPWTKAAEEMKGFEDGALARMNDWTKAGENGYFYNFNADATNQLKSPWNAGTNAANTFATSVNTAMSKVYDSVQSNVDKSLTKLNALDDGIKDTNVKPDGTVDTNNPPTTKNTSDGNSMSKADVKKLQYVLNEVFNANIKEDGSYGPATIAAVKRAQRAIGVSQDGYYGPSTKAKMEDYIRYKWQANNGSSSAIGQGIRMMLNKLPTSYYAKGTMGTSRDEWAITDESWIGEEITLAAGKNGQLQYLKKGSAVLPSEIATNLVEWGKLNPDMMKVGGGANINMISNAVTKPEFNFDVENFLKVERVDKDTLPELEKMMDKKIDNLVRQLNYSIKKFK